MAHRGREENVGGSTALDSTSQPIHLAAADQPTSVRQLTERLFPAYTIDGGRVHLAGCHLEDRLFVRLTFRHGDLVTSLYLGADGRQVPDGLIEALGMRETVPLEKPPRDAVAEIQRLAEIGAHLTARRPALESSPGVPEVAAIWCKFAQGKLRFSVGESSVDLPFGGWARTVQAPPFVCPYTKQSTFHLGATDDGRIVAADAIEPCDETGRRVLADELIACSITGRRVVRELVGTCPLTEKPILRKAMAVCGMCRQSVSPATIERDRCTACRRLQPVNKADPRMARLLDEHSQLDRWRHWRLSETATVYVLVASGWFKRLLVVADKESLEIKVMATGNRMASRWQVVDPVQYQYVLRE
jgi:hypothetical protein